MKAPAKRRRQAFRPRLVPLLAATLVVSLAILWLLPPLFDWQLHRAAIEAAASGFVGRDVRISGPIRVSLLPQPSVTAEQVEVRDNGDGTRMSAHDLTMSLSLGALLTGRLDVTHVALDRPDIRLPWPLPRGPLSLEPPPWLASLSAEVSHGRILVGPLQIEDASFTVATGGPSAALQVDGRATLAGRPWNLSLALSWPMSDGSAPLAIGADSINGPATSFVFTGAMRGDSKIAGRLTAHGDDLADLLPTPQQPFEAAGTLRADREGLRVDDLALVLGTTAATGALRFALPRRLRGAGGSATPIELRLHVPLIDIEPWALAVQKNPAPPLPLKVDFTADAATYGGGLLRRVALHFETTGGRLRIDNATASLPGESLVNLAGYYDPATAVFLGKAQVTAPSPAATLHWLTQAQLLPETGAIATALDSLDVAGDLRLSSGQMVATSITGRMNDTLVTGGLSILNGTHPSVAGALDFGKLDLGLWLPQAWWDAPPKPETLAHAITGVTADLRLSARQAWLGDTAIDHALVDLSVAGGKLVLRQLGGRIAGVQFVGSGAMDSSGKMDGVRLIVSAQPADRLSAFVPPRLRGAAGFWSAPLLASVVANGAPNRLALTVNASVGDLALSAQPIIDLAHMSGHGNVTLRHPNADRFLRDLGFGSGTTWLGEGSLSMVAEATVNGASWKLAPLAFSLGLVHGSGQIGDADSNAPDERGITGVFAIDTFPWPHPDPDEPIPTELLRGWQARLHLTIDRVVDALTPLATNVVADADIADNSLLVTLHRASALDGTLAGVIRLEARVPPAVSVKLTLADSKLATPIEPLPILTASNVDAQFSGTARGYSLGAWLSSLNGTASFGSGEATLSGIDLGKLGNNVATGPAAAGLSSGHTVFTSLHAMASVSQGELRLGNLKAEGPAGTLSATGTADLVRGACDLRVTVTPHGTASPPAPFDLLLQGPLDAPKRAVLQRAAG